MRCATASAEQRVAARAGSVEATISAGIQSEYNPQVRFFGPPIADEIRARFTGGAERHRAAVVGDVPDVALANFDAARCRVTGIVLNEVVDDLVVFASVTEIDGKGRILASAGPCLASSLSGFVVVGVMRKY